MRLLMIFAMALMLSASCACAFGGSGSISVDIVGSRTDNTKIFSSGSDNVNLEIVGSDANNTFISPPQMEKKCHDRCCRDEKEKCREWDQDSCLQGKKKIHPWDGMHLGVDAWYDTFWYESQINMPKWPQF
ncbi:Uncharacterised protein [uncultured archaeon]|nr:Uncharacterised protein [uncultured archaeon]